MIEGVDTEQVDAVVEIVARAVGDRRRLDAVKRVGLLDTDPEIGFDRIVEFAADLLATPFAFVTVVDDSRSFWKASVGVEINGPSDRQNPVEESFCQYVVGLDDAFMIDDTRVDPRTRSNPSVEKMGVAAWAGVPLRSDDGLVLGTVCVVDTEPRTWTDRDRSMLERLADIAAAEIAARRSHGDARRSEALLSAILERSPVGFALIAPDMTFTIVNESMAAINGISAVDHIGRPVAEVAPDLAADITALVRSALETNEPIADVELSGATAGAPGRRKTWLASYFRVDVEGRPLGVGTLVRDNTERTDARRHSEQLAAFTRRLAAVDSIEQLSDAVRDHGSSYLDAVDVVLAVGGPADRADPTGGVDRQGVETHRSGADDTPYNTCMRTGESVLIADPARFALEYPACVEGSDVAEPGSWAAIPIAGAPGRQLGALIVEWDHTHTEIPFPISRLNVMADTIAQTLERTERSAERRNLAKALQATLLSPPPSVDRLDLAVRYRPAGIGLGFGGDWYDIVSLDADRTALIVGDVIGHDPTAAARMSHVRTIISALIQLGTPLDEVYGRAEALLVNHEAVMHATVSVTIVDTHERSLTTVLAGHPPPVIVDPRGRRERVGHTRRALLGVPTPIESPTPIGYEPGSVFVAYTDGLVESRTNNIDDDIDRLVSFSSQLISGRAATTADIARDTATRITADAVADSILAEFGHEEMQVDDIALLVAVL